MKTIGIEISGKTAQIVALEETNGNYSDITGRFKKIELLDHYVNEFLREFQDTIFTLFDQVQPKRVGIVKRNDSGKFAGSAASFKMEGLIQTYKPCEIELVPLQTLTSHFKKNEYIDLNLHKYQDKAGCVAQYLMQVS